MSVVANFVHGDGRHCHVIGLFSAPRIVDAVRPSDFDTLEEIHASSFVVPWSADEMAALGEAPGVATFVARRAAGTASRRPIGFITVRRAADEAEVLTMAVLPRQRRGGVGRKLLDAALRHLYAERVRRVFLEVDPNNAGALALYRSAGFVAVGERPDYYAASNGKRQKALTMQLAFDQPLLSTAPSAKARR
ncbi:GNAT family N-acetyltransferase [Acuticoccus sp.]|uniref:GNAT family N-acetyltransferase n=1 Tax=Acuticoccus sp. TaxID=1904378 RepID=UPI003B52DE93